MPPQNEQLQEDVDFYCSELKNNDTCTEEKFHKKLTSANRQLEQCLDDLQVPPPRALAQNSAAFRHKSVLVVLVSSLCVR